MDKPTIGFIGVGAMGEPMVARLLNAGFRVVSYVNQSREAIERLLPQGLVEVSRRGQKVFRFGDRVFLPPKPTGDEVAWLTFARFAFNHLTQYIAVDQFADLERRGVVLEVLEALPLPRRQGGNQYADQDFAGIGFGDRHGFDAKVRIARQIGRTDGQMKTAIDV